ncbi:MAG: phosphatase PAP2 family protein, partial [Lapillicoccus sp.]
RPTVGQALRDLAVRVLLPAIVLWLVIVGIGKLIEGPLGGLKGESSVNQTLQAGRTPTWDTITMVWSRIGNTEIVIGVCVVMVALIWWLTKQWWVAVIPAIAIAIQATVFVVATAVTGRDRPEVEHLDPAPPTSSYPSGHVGAATALYFTLAALCQRIRNPALRWVLTVVCLLIPFLVGYARLYRGMHHLTDVIVGFVNGIVCAVLAWNYLRRDA